MKKLAIIVTIALSFSFTASSKSLNDYRKEALESLPQETVRELAKNSNLNLMNFDEIWLAGASNRRKRLLREAMGTSNLEIPGWNFEWNLNVNRSNRPSASDFLKRFMRSGISALKDLQVYSKPQTFDPSEYDFERDLSENKRVFDAFNQVIENQIGKGEGKVQFRDLAISFYDKYVKDERPEDNVACNDLSDVTNQFYDAELLQSHSGPAKILEDYIKNQAPAKVTNSPEGGPQSTSISDVLGKIRRLDVVDGKVRRLKITTCTKVPFGAKVSLLSKEETTVTLGILINIVTGMDAFFLKTQEFFIKMIDDLRTPLVIDMQRYYGLGKYIIPIINQEAEADLEIYDKILAVMKQRQEGAKFIHNQLMSLSKEQQFFLLDMLIQLQVDEIPSRQDVGLLDELRISKTSNPDEKFVHPNDMEDRKDMIADVDYFKSLDRDLGYLEDYLNEEVENNRAVEAAIERIGGQK